MRISVSLFHSSFLIRFKMSHRQKFYAKYSEYRNKLQKHQIPDRNEYDEIVQCLLKDDKINDSQSAVNHTKRLNWFKRFNLVIQMKN